MSYVALGPQPVALQLSSTAYDPVLEAEACRFRPLRPTGSHQKLVGKAVDNGFLLPELGAGIATVPGARSEGPLAGN